MRPRSLDEFVGQEHLVGPGRVLRRAIEGDDLSSLILYGPPGTGKNSLPPVIAPAPRSEGEQGNTGTPRGAELKKGIPRAQDRQSLYGKRTIPFIGENHRLNQ